MKPSAPPIATVDAQHPWLGLVSFTEETRSYFHGREEEGAELSRRVQRKLLTVLFGQSGLGKTSILQAGLVPRLRPEGFCPVYVRLDYNPHSPPPAEQIKRAVFRATEAAGTWTQTGAAVTGETLWEFLHHRDDVLKDAAGRTLIPILIFDQFEEIFTLAQSDDAGRKRAQEFLADLSDLVENRPPVALEARIERDEADAARFDFARADYRILISLREDYLAHLEGLKAQMPSVTQNRMRLARMTGAQAVAAVRAPAPHLVSEAVAEAVVRFVAGGADLARAEVEPSLLSLICRELNNARLAGGHAEISSDLLAGSRDTILAEFYERALADQPAGVRIFIEDEMLTESGFRESVAEERVRKGFLAAGANPEALALLVDRRLLRVEDRLDLRRVEITHDVLCSVIGASRSVRHEREALEESKRELAIQQEREATTRRALVRARLVATVAIVLMVLSAGSALFGWMSLRRARAAEAQTEHARSVAERARSESEKLIGFLLEDFYEELKPTGRVEIVGNLADKAVAYYEGLPVELMTPQTRLYRGMALVRKSSALANSGHEAESLQISREARKIFEQLRVESGNSDETTIALALAIFASISSTTFFSQTAELEEAKALLEPIVKAGRATRPAKLVFADIMNILAHSRDNKEEGVAYAEESRQILADLGALDLTDLTAASAYGDATDTQSRLEMQLGHLDEAKRLAQLVGETADKVLAQRPGDLRAMVNAYYSANVLGMIARDRYQFADAETYYRQSEHVARSYVSFNPSDSLGWRNLDQSNLDISTALFEQGKVAEALQLLYTAVEQEHDVRNKTGTDIAIYEAWRMIAKVKAQAGDLPAARAAFEENKRVGETILKERNLDEELSAVARLSQRMQEFDLLAAEGNYAAIHEQAIALADEFAKIKEINRGNRGFRNTFIRTNQTWIIESALRQKHPEEAVAAARQVVERALTDPGASRTNVERARYRSDVQLAEALIADGKLLEAQRILNPTLAFYRSRQTSGADGSSFRQDLGRALYFMAMAQTAEDAGRVRRQALLNEAAEALQGLGVEIQQLQAAQELIQWVNAARTRPGG